MKKILNLCLLAGTLALLTGCKGKNSVANDPKAVVVAFFEKMAKKDIEGATKLATKDSKSTMDMMKKAMDMGEKMGTKEKDPTEDFKNMKFGDAKIDGDKATVSVTNPAKGETAFDFPLVKEGGDWKVDFSMATLMKMGMDQAGKMNPQENGNNSFDTTGVNENIMSMDSLQQGLDKAKEMLEKIKPEDLEKAKEMMKDLEKMKEN